MRYRVFLLLGLLAIGFSNMIPSASAHRVTNYYNLESTTIFGFVESVENQVAYIRIGYDDEIAVQLGPASYWNAHRYYLTRGEYVEMLVWYDPADYYTNCYFVGEIWGSGYHYRLTNREGVPYWVTFADDYYYSLGYRASCVSFMFWYDCPPVYFVYLILPPPPPRIYICYYGPRWRTHYRDWHYGPRYCRGGSYWRDGQGYERHGRRLNSYAAYDSKRDGRRIASDRTAKYSDNFKRSESSPTPRVVKPRTERYQKLSQKSQSDDNRKTVYQHRKPHSKRESRVTVPVHRVPFPKAVPQERQFHSRNKVQPTKTNSTSKAVHQGVLDNSKTKSYQSTRTPKVEKRATTSKKDQGGKQPKRQ